MESMRQKVEDLVECVVCLEVPRRGHPILQCGGPGGHIMCDVCDGENDECPECDETSARTRVPVVEKVHKEHKLKWQWPAQIRYSSGLNC